ncbi:hypothetical protein [Xanthomonas sacchari]|uniref:Uncharacterized protein n=1 Tax=Xanthomonas sacchari TaxID=56458 RepID=A0AA46SUW8_9XANT|nr:hypothetical protein [Xanthomonas sacchari]UYK89013.1 hypothetical protein NG824_00655 [Xanthomonas sacchari]
MEKFHELALAGDKAAEKEVAALERIRVTGDVRLALSFEREILSKAMMPFELVSHLEHIDLNRLLEDRNRCAHPSLVAEGEAYSPPGELARLHIRNAVTTLLKHPPAQGKYALERLLADVRSDLFPRKKTEAQDWLASGALKNPRDSLVHNFVFVLLKDILLGEDNFESKQRLQAALNAVSNLHPQAWREAMLAKLSPCIRQINDSKLIDVILFFRLFRHAWELLDVDVSQKLLTFIKEMPAEDFYAVELLLDVDEFRADVLKRINRATIDEIDSNIWFTLPQPIGDRLISLYLNSNSFVVANKIGRSLASQASDLTVEQAMRILSGISKNPEILGSFDLPNLLAALSKKNKGIQGLGEFSELLRKYDLAAFVDSVPP